MELKGSGVLAVAGLALLCVACHGHDLDPELQNYCEAKRQCVGTDVDQCRAPFVDAISVIADDEAREFCESDVETVLSCVAANSVCQGDVFRLVTPTCEAAIAKLNGCCGAVVIDAQGQVVGDLTACFED